MKKIFTQILPVDNVAKSPVQNFQQRYVINAWPKFLSFFLPQLLRSLYENHAPMSILFF